MDFYRWIIPNRKTQISTDGYLKTGIYKILWIEDPKIGIHDF